MIPLSPGDIAKAISAVGTIVDLIKRPERANKLAKWAEFLKPEPTDQGEAKQFAHDRIEFLQALTQDLGFTPWYAYSSHIDVPKDLMCDLVDLLVVGPQQAKKGWLSALLSTLLGGKKKPKDDFDEWADLIARRKPDDILDFLKALVARMGRTRHYEEGGPTLSIDLDWLGDAGMALLNQA